MSYLANTDKTGKYVLQKQKFPLIPFTEIWGLLSIGRLLSHKYPNLLKENLYFKKIGALIVIKPKMETDLADSLGL